MGQQRMDYAIPLEDGLAVYDDASEGAADRLQKLGICLVDDRPQKDGEYFDGQLPSNVNSLSVQELGELLGIMDRHANWLQDHLVIAKAELKNAEEQVKFVKAKVRKSKTGTKDAQDDETIIDSRYVAVNGKWMEAYEYHEILSGAADKSRRNLRTISRLIETKRLQIEQGIRVDNAPKKPRRDRFRRER